jgi:hypothetical protein
VPAHSCLTFRLTCSTAGGGTFGGTGTAGAFGQPTAQPTTATSIFGQPQQQQTSAAFGKTGSSESRDRTLMLAFRSSYWCKTFYIWSVQSTSRNNHQFRYWPIRRSATGSANAAYNRSLRNNSKYRYQSFRPTATAATLPTTDGWL